VDVSVLPAIDASLNGLSALLLVAGFVAVRSRRIELHKKFMLAAVISSAVFLACYLTYHVHRTYVSGLGPTRFGGQGAARSVYFTILLSHTVLAVAVLPLVLVTVWRALRGRFDRHRRVARWTLPIWLYVSVTGVVVYFMLYHMYGPAVS
jgi:uncharacterized membrane protein YozB (DUF420 family)